MDPLTALGLAANIVQFVDFGFKLLGGAREIYSSASGATKDNEVLESVTKKMDMLSIALSAVPTTPNQSQEEKDLSNLAAECAMASNEIFKLLAKIKPKNPKSKLQIGLSIIKTKVKENDIAALEKRIDKYRSQIHVLISADMRAKVEVLLNSGKADAKKIKTLQETVNQLLPIVEAPTVTPELQKTLRDIVDLAKKGERKLREAKILSSLFFKGMHGRFDAVADAHHKTFEWIFEDEITEHQKELRGSFRDWLSSGNGIFHISGKLGSGKSTLMKFLCEQRKTEAELKHWAGARELVFPAFFFWRVGTVLQRSLFGLFRSLLHDTLKSCPELIPAVFPDQWAEVEAMPPTMTTVIEMSNRDIRQAFSRVIEHRNLYKEYRFCFFIDGLDEYEETSQEDYKALVELLSSWVTAAPDAVKLCVASREYNVFLNMLSPEKRIRLQDLTREDMAQYARDKLEGMDREKGKEQMIQKIVEKASGIFLWVTLVVRSLRELLEGDFNDLEILERELDTLPPDLEDLFVYLLKSIHPLLRPTAYRTLAMVLKGIEYNLTVSLFSYSFFQDYENDGNFATRQDFAQNTVDKTWRDSQERTARKRLNGLCKGLLEVSEGQYKRAAIIEFTHRSVPEFLAKGQVKSEMELHLNGFTVEKAIAQLFLVDIRWGEYDPYYTYIRGGGLNTDLLSVFRMLNDSGTDRVPYPFREYLSSAVVKMEQTDRVKGDFPYDSSGLEATGIYSPLVLGVIVGDYNYVRWKLESDPATTHSNMKLLLEWILEAAFETQCEGCFKLVELFLDKGLSPSLVVSDGYIPYYPRGYDRKDPCPRLLSLSFKPYPEGELNFWQMFIFNFLADFDEGGSGYLKGRCNDFPSGFICHLVQLFLERGADPHVYIRIMSRTSRRHHLSTVKRDSYSVEVAFGKKRKKLLHLHDVRRHIEELLVRKDGHVSLRELIEDLKPNNRATLLRLIDGKRG